MFPFEPAFWSAGQFKTYGFSSEVQVILRALKKYGMILADNGSAWYISSVPDDRWDNDRLHELHQVPGSAFEAVDVSSLIEGPSFRSNPLTARFPPIPDSSARSREIIFPLIEAPAPDYSPLDALTYNHLEIPFAESRRPYPTREYLPEGRSN